MKKYCLDLEVKDLISVNSKYILLKLTTPATATCNATSADSTSVPVAPASCQRPPLPEMLPGQFVEIRTDVTPDAVPSPLLRRPISIHFVDYAANELWLLVAVVGKGTRQLAALKQGDIVNCLLPLGNGFTMPASTDEKILLVGGGVGVAPLLYAGQKIRELGAEPVFLLGARSAKDLLELDLFRQVGRVYVTTEDGSEGEKGFVTNHSLLTQERFTRISVCGPSPMMKAVAKLATTLQTPCEVSLENKMACGLGACLCCVEDTSEGNVCVCKDGPVFDIQKLKW